MNMEISRAQEFIDINVKMHNVINKTLASEKILDYDKWKWIYDYVFSDNCITPVMEIHRFDWFDPDCDYQDDAQSFITAFDEECEKVKTLI